MQSILQILKTHVYSHKYTLVVPFIRLGSKIEDGGRKCQFSESHEVHDPDVTGWSGVINAAVLNIVLSFRHTPNSSEVFTVKIA